MLRIPRIIVPVVALAACADPSCPVGFVLTDGVCAFNEAAVQETVRALGSDQLVRVNAEPFVQVLGTQYERNVWVSPVPVPEVEGLDAAALYAMLDPGDGSIRLEAAMPVRTLIVHEAVNREEGHAVAVKRDDYLDENGRAWWMAKIWDDGSFDENACQPCSDCHSDNVRPNSEGLWGVPHESM
jgi:hypothetical protein